MKTLTMGGGGRGGGGGGLELYLDKKKGQKGWIGRETYELYKCNFIKNRYV